MEVIFQCIFLLTNDMGTLHFDETGIYIDKIKVFENKYSQILEEGFKEDYIINTEAYTQKKVKKSTSLNLLNRFN